jgi:hypothetical protein
MGKDLSGYYDKIFVMAQHHKYSITEIEALMPFELDIYISLLNDHLKEIERENRKRTTM